MKTTRCVRCGEPIRWNRSDQPVEEIAEVGEHYNTLGNIDGKAGIVHVGCMFQDEDIA